MERKTLKEKESKTIFGLVENSIFAKWSHHDVFVFCI